MNSRFCPFCDANKIVKIGKQCGKQRYLCKQCRKSWSSKSRPNKLETMLWNDYTCNYDPIRVLAKRYGKSPSTVRRILAKHTLPRLQQSPRAVVLVMDVTYFGRSHGELVVIDANAGTHENLLIYCQALSGTERTADYRVAVDTTLAMGYEIKACVIDGRRGVREMLRESDIPVQYCQFHQLQTITQCLTKNPILEPNIELRRIALALTTSTRKQFEATLDAWILKHESWLKSRYTDEYGRVRFVHSRTRRAYFSLRRNLPYLFTYLEYPELNIPNTTNKLDGRFGVVKANMKVHRGYSLELKTKMFYSLLSGGTGRGIH